MTFWSVRFGRMRIGAAAIALACPLILPAQRQNGLLVGRVLSGDVAVPGATIIVSGGRATLARVDGRFSLSLPAGRYEVRAQRIGFSSARDSITVTPGVTDTAVFKLDRAMSRLEAVAVVGTRGYERSVIESPDAVEVIDGTTLRATGRTQTSQALQAAQASINVSHATVGQGTDLIRPFSMRGLGADEVLVLVNGKRHHSSAQVDLMETPARGSSGVDLDAIPVSMIERIEVLHGDAVAQYGGDAIAGVINVVLKSGVHGFASTTGGGSVSTFNRDESPSATPYFGGAQSASDGRVMQASIDKGVVFGERGFLHGGLEVRDHGATNRSLGDPALVGAYAPLGDPHSHDGALYLNGGNLFGNGVELYGDAGGSHRSIDAPTAALLGVTTVTPMIDGTSSDYTGTVGVRGRGDDWRWDLSTVYGWNRIGLGLAPAVNAITGATASATLDAGAQRFAQSTTALELARELPWLEETRLAFGGEVRQEAYRVSAGEPAAYTPDVSASPYWYGLSAFTPAQATDRSRMITGAHLDLESDLTETFQLGASGRAEHYADVGTQGAGKLSARFEPMRRVVFRGSVARGYHAPSLQQSSLAMMYESPVQYAGMRELALPTDPRALSLGGGTLRAERSTDFQLGAAIELTPALSITLDAYRTDIADRLSLTGDYSAFNGSSYLLFFANNADTRTDGLDATLGYGMRFVNGASLRLAAGANVNHSRVLSASASVDPVPLVAATPRDNLIGSATFEKNHLGALLRTQRFGSVVGLVDGRAYPARWVTDANVSYTLARKYTFTAGADNLFDAYPQRIALPTLAYSGLGLQPVQMSPNFYDASSPFGFNGRFLYGRLSIYL